MRLSRPPEEALLLALIGTAPCRAACAADARQFFGRCDPDALHETFAWDRLQCLAGTRLVDLLGEQAPRWVGEWVEDEMDAARDYAAVHEIGEATVLGLMQKAGIGCMCLKGTRLARDVYPEPGLRVGGDVDLLVATDELHRAVDVLTAAGWMPPGDPPVAGGLPRLHYELEAGSPGMPPVELHWRISFHETTWAQRVLARSGSRGAEIVPSPTDLMAVLMLCLARDGLNNFRLAADLAACWDRFGDEALAGLADAAQEEPDLRRALVTSAVATETLVGLPTCRVLGWTHRTPGCSRAALRIAAAPLAVTVRQRHSERRLHEPLLAPRGMRAAAARTWFYPGAANARYLRPESTATRGGLALDVAASAGVTPLRTVLTSLRAAGVTRCATAERLLDRSTIRRA